VRSVHELAMPRINTNIKMFILFVIFLFVYFSESLVLALKDKANEEYY
jgi:hypothetical protein